MNENHQKLIRKYFIQKQSSGGVQQKKVFFEILQNSQESTFAGVNFIKKGTPAQVFSCEFLRTPFFVEHLRWLLLNVGIYQKYSCRKTQLNCYQVRKRVTLVRLSTAFESPLLQPQPLQRYLAGLSKIQSFLKGNAAYYDFFEKFIENKSLVSRNNNLQSF